MKVMVDSLTMRVGDPLDSIGHANRIVEALSRYGDRCEEKVHSVLTQQIKDYQDNPMKWLEPLMVRRAGEIALDSAVPMLIAKLIDDGGDLLNEECARSFTKIESPTVIRAVSEVYAESPYDFRLYATNPLESIHSDLAVETCLNLLQREKARDLPINLAFALLSHFSRKGIEEARRLLLGHPLDFDSRGLRNYLLDTAAIMEERFPESEEWSAARRIENEEHRRRMKKLENHPIGLLRFAFERLTQEASSSSQQGLNLPVTPGDKQRVRRNALCPCGSGKKFKKCCMKKSSGNSFVY